MEPKSFDLEFQGTVYRAHYIQDPDAAYQVIQQLNSKDVMFGIDTETAGKPAFRINKKAGLSPLYSDVRLLQIFDGKNIVVFDMYYVPVQKELVEFLSTHKFLAHNALFELQRFKQWGVQDMDIGCTYILTKLLYHAIYPSDEGISAGLDKVVKEVLKVDLSKKMQVSDWSVQDLTFEQIKYSALDPLVTVLVGEKLAPGLTKYGLNRIYSLCKGAQHPIAAMQLNGLAFDAESHAKLIPVWRNELYAAKKKVLELTGLTELTAVKLGEWFEKTLDKKTLMIWPRTDSGRLSTDSHTLNDFQYLPVVKPFAEYQKKEKLSSTYGNALLQNINKVDGRIHASYNLCGARTGRLSSSDPNLQNLPRDSSIRSHFNAPAGKILLVADYSQIEIRVGAELSRDAEMLRAYENGVDIHTLTASNVSGKRLSEITKSDRQMAKAVNFGFMFGLGASKFSKYAKNSYGVDVSSDQAHEAINTWRNLYNGYYEWQMNQANLGAQTHQVRTPTGKLRRLQDDNTYGAAMNTPVQGGAAEVMLSALCELNKQSTLMCDEFKLVNCVHDEIVIETLNTPEYISVGTELIQDCMKAGFLRVFPTGITRDLSAVGYGANWAEAKK